MKYIKTYRMNNENFITNVKRKLINKNLEVKKYVYGDTIPTIGEKKMLSKNIV
jgi:hypothetical protein